jgi:hypothetical protein
MMEDQNETFIIKVKKRKNKKKETIVDVMEVLSNKLINLTLENDEEKYKFNISDVVSDEKALTNYIKHLNEFIKNKTLFELIEYARTICYGLPSEEQLKNHFNSDKNKKDKGLVGKAIEYALFGQIPNNKSNPDIVKLGYDIKTCAFKTLKNNGKNAKERQTLTNCGNTNNYDSFKNICDNEKFSECQYYEKSKKFILFVRNDDKIMLKTFDQLLNQKMLVILCFDIEKLPSDMIETINIDYESIRRCIIEKKVSQKGQKYLHIHTHGMGHGSGNRALGFTSSFITQLVALTLSEIYNKNLDDILIKEGKGIAIKNEYL